MSRIPKGLTTGKMEGLRRELGRVRKDAESIIVHGRKTGNISQFRERCTKTAASLRSVARQLREFADAVANTDGKLETAARERAERCDIDADKVADRLQMAERDHTAEVASQRTKAYDELVADLIPDPEAATR